jgi:UDP-apiose/xylose synthase
MRICLFGCGGFIGSHLVEWLLRHSDAELVGTDIDHQKVSHLLAEPRFTYYDSDLRHDAQLTRHLVETSDVAINLVAIANPAVYTRDPLHVFQLDFMENLKVAQLCAELGRRLVQFSTCEVYGRTWLSLVPPGLIDPAAAAAADVVMREDETPLIAGPVHKTRWIYAASKHLLERAIHAYGMSHGLNYTIIRPFNFIGPRFDYLPSQSGGEDRSPRMFAQFMDALLHGTPMALVDGGRAQRCFLYIDDATECIGRVILDQQGLTTRETFNVGNPANEASVAEFAALMLEVYRERHWDGRAPLPALEPVSGEAFFGAGYEDSDRRIPDIAKARRLLGWEPRWGLRDLIAATMASFVEDYQHRTSVTPAGAGARTL